MARKQQWVKPADLSKPAPWLMILGIGLGGAGVATAHQLAGWVAAVIFLVVWLVIFATVSWIVAERAGG